MDFTRTWLIDLTLRVTKRPPNAPTEWQIFDLIPNTLPLNYVSWAVTTANGWHSQQSTVAKDMHLVTGGAPAWCQSYPCTFGQFVFLNGRSPTTTLLGHEYIHILEGEGLGIDFVRQYLSSEIGNQIFNAGLNALANVANWPPSLRASWNNLQLPSAANVMEAPAWLWEAFGGSSWYVPSDLPWRLWSPAPFVGITM
jgi:hypothetical protein